MIMSSNVSGSGGDDVKKMSESQTKAPSGNQEFKCLNVESCESSEMVSVHSWDMLNNFCFHVYTQKCQVVRLLGCQVVKFDHWDMVNNFLFVFMPEKSLFIGENGDAFFDTLNTLACEWTGAGSQLMRGNVSICQKLFQLLQKKCLNVRQKLGTRNVLKTGKLENLKT